VRSRDEVLPALPLLSFKRQGNEVELGKYPDVSVGSYFYSFKRLFGQLENNDTDTIKVPAQSPFGCDVLPFAAIRRNRHIWPWQMLVR